MNLTIIQKFNINSLGNFRLPPELSGHHIAAKGVLNGQLVISLLTEEEMMNHISENAEMVRFIAPSAVYLDGDEFLLPCALLDFAHIESTAYIVKDEKNKYYICSAGVAEWREGSER